MKKFSQKKMHAAHRFAHFADSVQAGPSASRHKLQLKEKDWIPVLHSSAPAAFAGMTLKE